MIKVIQKTFDALEYVYRRDAPVLPRELAERLDLPLPTAARLLRDLMALGYLEQDGRRKGYRRGPMAAVLAGTPDDEFLRFAAYHIDEAARRIGQAIVLSRRHRNFRCLLCHRNHNPSFEIDTGRLRVPNLYRTTAGRVLLAYASSAERDEVLAMDGPPTFQDWPEAEGDAARTRALLDGIRKTGFVELSVSRDGQSHAFALPLFRDYKLYGAVTVYWNTGLDDSFSARCRDCARALVRVLAEPRQTISG